jgi:hypothetical protein
MSNNEHRTFTIKKEDYNKMYKLADAVKETTAKLSGEYAAANALSQRLDQAIEDDEPELIFTEMEVQVLSAVVS